jgi:CRISPR-associated endoribonuclease Cas6
MRLLIRLEAQADAVYDHAAHHQLRGRIWRALDGTEFTALHDADRPIGLCFSNVFPWGDITEGEQRNVLVSAADPDLLRAISAGLAQDREFNVGEMSFEVTEVTPVSPDVGEPGTRGTIESGTGLLVRIPAWKVDADGIDTDGDGAVFWRPEHSMEPLQTQLQQNLDKKHELFCPEELPGPTKRGSDLFSEYELIKTFALPLEVTQGEERTVVLSKWRFEYEVRDEHHRRHLNLALDAGIGERNALGLGFVNIVEDSKVSPRAALQGQEGSQ